MPGTVFIWRLTYRGFLDPYQPPFSSHCTFLFRVIIMFVCFFFFAIIIPFYAFSNYSLFHVMIMLFDIIGPFFIKLKVFWAIIFDAIIIHFTPQVIILWQI